MSKLMEYYKNENEISLDVNFLRSIIDDSYDYLESVEKLNEIHSRAWTIQLKAESMLKFLSEKK